MKKIDEIYRIRPTYKRFDQRKTAFSRVRSMFLQRIAREPYGRRRAKLRSIREGKAGFSLLDYAFSGAAFTVPHTTGSDHGRMNSELYSWSPLGATRKPGEVENFKADPMTAPKIIKKAARYYGAVLVGICLLDKRWVYSHDVHGRKIGF